MSHKTLTLGNLDEPNIDISDDEEYDEPNIDILDDDNLFESDENINYSSEEDDNEENDEVDEHNYEEEDDIPAPTTKSSEELTPCVVMINRNGVIERCGAKNTSNQKRLWNLIGTWEVDTKTVNEMKERTDRLGVCTTHFHYDQNNLHPRGLKQMKSYETGVIRHFRCTLCKKYFRTFCRIYGCDVHCWSFAGKTMQIPCIGQYKCPMVKAFPPLIQKTESARQMQYVCCACYASQGGHLHDQKAMGDDDTECTPNKHAKNARKTVKILGELMLNAAETKDDAFNDRLSKLAAPMLKVFQEPSTTEIELPSVSPFMVTTILKANGMSESSLAGVNAGTSRKFGEDIAELIWKSRGEINNNRDTLEKPNSLYDYQCAFPQILTSFFLGLVSTLFKKRLEVKNRKKPPATREVSLKIPNKISRMTVFLSSIILATAFKKLKLLSVHSLASVCQKPKLLPSLRSFLESVNAISHTSRHEHRLWRRRMQAADPVTQLQTDPFTWNVCVIDNVDLREATYKYGNIYDVAGKSFHATLRMIFQFKLPIRISSIPNRKTSLNNQDRLFGENNQTKAWFQEVNNTFKALVSNNNSSSFNMDETNKELAESIPIGCRIEKPNVVILGAGDSPSSNESIFATCLAYFKDLKIIKRGRLDIWADQAIHQRLIKFNNKSTHGQLQLRVGLGQWHTSNVMCTALILMFSSYGIYNCAYELGVTYLEKFEYNSDYRATCRILEMIWASTGIALHNYLTQKGLTLGQLITRGDNKLAKVWALYFKWASFWKGHKIGIRRGNSDMQFSNLAAFAPLFPCAGRVNYFKSVAHFLAEYKCYPQLQELLRHACSVNITQEGHYLAFDEALEFFGVKFVKQNLKNRIIDEEDLKQQIKAVQSERARTDLLFSIFNDDNNNIASKSAHTVNNRSKAVEKLAKKMLEAFNSQSPEEHSLFIGCTQLTPTGYNNIFDSYREGLDRLQDFYNQEIIEIEEIDTTGRAHRSVVVTHSKDIVRALTSKMQREVAQLNAASTPIIVIEQSS